MYEYICIDKGIHTYIHACPIITNITHKNELKKIKSNWTNKNETFKHRCKYVRIYIPAHG